MAHQLHSLIPRSANPLWVGILVGTEQPRHSGHAFRDPWMFRSYMPVLAAASSDAELGEVNPAWLPELCPKFFGASLGHSLHILGGHASKVWVLHHPQTCDTQQEYPLTALASAQPSL